ncbi:MAG: hypothetical protein AAF604_03820 [Acidobacteriota bacterium]
MAQRLGDGGALNTPIQRRLLPAVLGLAAIAPFYGPLAVPGNALATRDFAFFHLPLRAAFARLVGEGLPLWNPWLHGGQPLLSNPSYGAFYPPNWLVLLVEPVTALAWLVIFHAAVAWAGAWALTRRLGASSVAAGLAAFAFVAGGFFVSLLHAYTLFAGLAWLPWTLWATVRLLAADTAWRRPAVMAAMTLAATLLNGEPVTVLISGLALLCFAATTLRRAPRVLLPVALATLLAAPQLVPTFERLRDSPRSGGLAVDQAGVWSTPPERLAELVVPRLFGDAMRSEEGLYFGGALLDREFPYVLSLYPGLLVFLLAIWALSRGDTAWRGAWLLMLIVGLGLGLGRFNPLFPWLVESVPLLGQVRYPEKFLLLALAALPFLAALGWQGLVEARRGGRLARLDVALVVAGLLAVAAGVGALVAARDPAWLRHMLQAGSSLQLSPEGLSRGTSLLARELGWSAATALASLAVLLSVRHRRWPMAWAASLLVLVVVGDLWRVGHSLVRVRPALELATSPPLVSDFTPSGQRIFVDEMFYRSGGQVLLGDQPGMAQENAKLGRLDPYSGLLWGLSYALHEDFDLMLTGWGRHALERLRQAWGDPWRTARLLGAWNVHHLVLRLPTDQQVVGGPPARVLDNGSGLPRYRFVRTVVFHRDLESAVAADWEGAGDYLLVDHWVRPEGADGEALERPRAEVLQVSEAGSRIALAFRAAGEGGFLVAAITYDEGWSAELGGEPIEIRPTALGQLGIALPPGAGRLELRYRDSSVFIGAVLGGVGWLLLVPLLWWRRRPTPSLA